MKYLQNTIRFLNQDYESTKNVVMIVSRTRPFPYQHIKKLN